MQFEISIVEQCNLNCAYCTHFAPCVTTDEFLQIEAFERDMRRMSDITGGRIDYLKIMGGEPLLHPEVAEFLRVGRECFPVGGVDLYTNGIMLKDMPREFWKACRDYCVRVVSARYPTVNHKQIERLCAINGIELWWASHKPFKRMNRYLFDETGKQDGHSLCGQLGTNAQFRDGKLYPCTRPANVRHLNKYFGTNFEVSDGDGIDIHQDGVTLETLKEHLYKQISFCRYCINDDIKECAWTLSKRTKTEWIKKEVNEDEATD